MPGKKVGEYAWRYMSQAKLLRDVTTPDDPNDVEGVVESIDHYNVEAATLNQLSIFAMMAGAMASAVVEIYLNPRALDGANDEITSAYRWCKLATQTITGSEVISIDNVPPGIIKVLVTGFTGASSSSSLSSGSPANDGIRICYSKTA